MARRVTGTALCTKMQKLQLHPRDCHRNSISSVIEALKKKKKDAQASRYKHPFKQKSLTI